MASPRSAVTGNPISMTAQKQAEHYLQATTSSTAKNQPSIFEPNLMFAVHFLLQSQLMLFRSSRSEVAARSTSRSDGSAGDARTSRSDGPLSEGQIGEENRNLREKLDQTVRQLNLLRDRHWSDSQELQRQVAQKTIEINRLETDARKRMGASSNGEDNLELLKEQFRNRQLEAELAAIKENQHSYQQRGSSETTANIQSMVQRFTEKVQLAEEKHAAIQKILDEKNSSIRQLESKLLRRKEGRSGAIERYICSSRYIN
jgi:chromosome segregation ATPase